MMKKLEKFLYTGKLGALFTSRGTTFRLWAPTAQNVMLNLYDSGNGDEKPQSLPMLKDETCGIWSAAVLDNMHKTYYTYTVTHDGVSAEVVDPYAKGAGVNGKRGMVVDFSQINPEGWETQSIPKLSSPVDAVIYEAHIRDFTIDPSSGVSEKNRGKFLGMVEGGTVNEDGLATGLDHLKELGITDIHILPVFDYNSVDESKPSVKQYNWGYDPLNYNVPEGSYSSDAFDGGVRIQELKEMIMKFHNNGIRVIMDVVYNHTALSDDSNFNKIVPHYYHRVKNGAFTNGSGCGNETASEKPMMREFIIDSLLHWATEYKIDGFRFDLMGLHDIKTMNAIYAALSKVNPDIFIYGEPWTGGLSSLPKSKAALKANVKKIPKIAIFNDDTRNAVKGGVFADEKLQRGFASGAQDKEDIIKKGVKAGIQSINYASCHDNLTLFDKLEVSNKANTLQERLKMNRFAMGIIFTMQGIPFFLSGEEFTRSKLPDGTLLSENDIIDGFVANSYKSSDAVNALKWNLKSANKSLFNYYKSLISLRKENPEFRLRTKKEINKSIRFFKEGTLQKGVIGYTVKGVKSELIVFYNGGKTSAEVILPGGNFDIILDGESYYSNAAVTTQIKQISGKVEIPDFSVLVLRKHL